MAKWEATCRKSTQPGFVPGVGSLTFCVVKNLWYRYGDLRKVVSSNSEGLQRNSQSLRRRLQLLASSHGMAIIEGGQPTATRRQRSIVDTESGSCRQRR